MAFTIMKYEMEIDDIIKSIEESQGFESNDSDALPQLQTKENT